VLVHGRNSEAAEGGLEWSREQARTKAQ
jgi:hypothetical protein